MCSGSCSTFLSIRRWEANSLSFFVLRTLVLSLLAHREFFGTCPPRHEARLDQFSHAMDFFFFCDCVTFVNFCMPIWTQDFVLFRGLHEDFGGSSSWSILNQLSCTFKVATEFQSLFASAWQFISLMVHPSTLIAEFTRRWSCAITIQASTAVEIVFQMDCAHGLSSGAFPPIFSLVAFHWDPRLLDSSSGRALEFQSTVSSEIKKKKLERKIEKLCRFFSHLGLWSGCCLDHHSLLRVSPYLLAPEYFPW